MNRIKDQSAQYREMLNRSRQSLELPAKAPIRGGDVKIFSEGSAQVEGNKPENSWVVRGPELLREKELMQFLRSNRFN